MWPALGPWNVEPHTRHSRKCLGWMHDKEAWLGIFAFAAVSRRARLFFSSQINFLQCNHTLTANPCSVAKQMRRLQITQFRNRTPPYSRNPICRSPPPTTKQHRRKLVTATKNRDPIHSGCWAEQNLIAKCLGIDRCHGDGNEIPTCFPWGARVAQPSWTGRTRRAIPATKLSRYKRTTGLCEE